MIARWIIGMALALSALPAWAAESPTAISTRLLDHLQAREYAAVEAMFAPPMAQAVPADKLKALWESLPAQLGAFERRGEPRVSEQQGMRIAITRLEFAQGALDAQVAIDAQDRVAGLMLRPAAAAAAAPVDANASFEEIELRIGDGERALPATLAMPKGSGPFAAVVLVHGSGPQDRDETIGPNRPFLDLARGLAAQGIAVLRYEKRTHARPQDFAGGKGFDIDDEVTDDAVLAVATLRAQARINPARVFVLGHSLGGMLAPRIALQSKQVAGLILLAAPARSLLTILPEQNRYLLGEQGVASDQGKAFLAKLDAQIAHVRGDAPDASTDTPLGLPAGYWRSLEAVHPIADADTTNLPILFLQGGRDFQVIDTDWQLWRSAFAGKTKATFRHYPSLNHLGIAGEGAGSLAEYQRPGHVDATLITDIARWIGEH